MKTLIAAIALFIASCANVVSANPGEPATHQLTIRFDNVQQRSGALYIGIISEDGASTGAFFRKTRVTVTPTGEVQARFANLPAGRYAVKVYQDLNGNAKLDYNGPMPTEPYGFSNVTTLTGPTTFERLAISLDASRTVTISLLN